MNHSASVKTKNLKPFQKGEDSRRHKHGSASEERAAWTSLFLNRLAERLDPKKAADILATAYEAKRSWAVMEVHERLMGKEEQPIDLRAKNLTIKVVQVKDGNGNANAN